MARQTEGVLKCLLELSLLDGRVFRFHNFSTATANRVIVYQNKNWNYLPFPIPIGTLKMGEDNQSIKVTLPNVGSGEYGYVPIRDWVQDGTMEGAFFVITILIDDLPKREMTYTMAERELRDDWDAESGNSSGVISLSLRQPDDGYAKIITQTIDESLVGTGIKYSPT